MKKTEPIPTDLLGLVDAFEAETGRRPALKTTLRWVRKGRHGIRLRAWCLGGRFLTNRQSVSEWINDVTAISLGTPTPSEARRTQKQRERDMDRAEHELAEIAKK